MISKRIRWTTVTAAAAAAAALAVLGASARDGIEGSGGGARRARRGPAPDARRGRHGHLGPGLHGLLSVRQRNLAVEEPDPRRPAAVGDVRRAAAAQPGQPAQDPRPAGGRQVGAEGLRRAEARRLLRRLHGRGGDRGGGPGSDRPRAREDRGDPRSAEPARRDRPPPVAWRQRALRLRLRGGPRGLDEGHRGRVAERPRPSRARFLHPHGREIGQGARPIRRARREDAGARRLPGGQSGGGREDDPGARDEARQRVDEQRGFPRSVQDASPDDARRLLESDPESRVDEVFRRAGPGLEHAAERLAAGLLPGGRQDALVRAPRVVEDLSALAPDHRRRPDAAEEVRGRELRLLRKDPRPARRRFRRDGSAA